MEVKTLLIGLLVILAVSVVKAGPVKSFDLKSNGLLNKEPEVVRRPELSACNRQITVIYDASNALSPSLFEKLQDFIDNQLFNNFTDFELQSTKGAVIRRVLEWVAHNQRYVEGKQTILLLVGSLSEDDIEDSKSPANEIRRFAKLSLIGLQDSVKKANLDKISDYSYVLDLNSPLPDDLQDIVAQAFGC